MPRNPNCTRCVLSQSCKTPCIWGVGPKSAAIMLVGEAPGAEEDEQGRPFVGKAGQTLNKALHDAGLSRDDIYVTNSIRCRPERNDFKLAEAAGAPTACFKYLAEEIEQIKPRVVVAVGVPALKALTGKTGIKDNRGSVLTPHPKIRLDNIKIITTWHPSYVNRVGKFAPDRRLYQDLVADLNFAKRISDVHASTAVLPKNAKQLLMPGYSLRALERALQRVDTKHVVLDGEWTALPDRKFTYPWSKGGEMLSAAIAAWHDHDTINSLSFAFPLPRGGKGLLNEFLSDKKVSNHNIQVDAIWLWWLGIYFEIEHDTMHALFVLDEEQKRGLEVAAMLYAGVSATWKQPVWPHRPQTEAEYRKLLEYNCFPANTLVSHPSGAKRFYKRWYSGPLVTIRTKRGYTLSGTPNHPILTENGWVSLNRLVVGQHVISRTAGEKLRQTDHNPNRGDMPIGEVFRLAEVSRPVERAVGTYDQFHGDGQESYVEVIRTDGELVSWGQTELSQPTNYLKLPASCMAERLLSDKRSLVKCIRAHVLPLIGQPTFRCYSASESAVAAKQKVPCFTHISQYSESPESGFDCCSFYSKLPCDHLTALALLIESENYLSVKGSAPSAVPRRPQFNTSTFKAHENCSCGKSIPLSDLSAGFTGFVSLDEIVDIRIDNFSGHVYNLETPDHQYLANNIVAGNCNDVWATVLLLDALIKKLHSKPEPDRTRLWRIYRRMCKAIPSYVEMAHTGMPVDLDQIRKVRREVNEKQQEAVRKFADFLKTSPEQAFKIATNTRETTKFLRAQYHLDIDSSRAEILDDISNEYPAVPLIKEIRHPQKLKSAYLDPWEAQCIEQGDNTIHAVYSQELVTGRTSASTGYRGATGQVIPSEIKGVVRAPKRRVVLAGDLCLARGTEVQTIRGPKTIETVRAGEWVYCVGKDGRPSAAQVAARKFTGYLQVYRLVLQPRPKGRHTKVTPETVEVLATADHKFMMRNGSYKRVRDMAIGDRLMHMTHYLEPITGYVRLYTHRGSRSEHTVIIEALRGKPLSKHEVVHHRNRNRADNRPDNLEVLTSTEHRSHHGREQWETRPPEVAKALRQKMGAAISVSIAAKGGRKGERNGHFGHRGGSIVCCVRCGQEFYCYPSTPDRIFCSKACYNSQRAITRITADGTEKRKCEHCKKVFSLKKGARSAQQYCSIRCRNTALAQRQGLNHKLISIEPVAILPTYCLDVPGPRNFMLTSGLISSNSQVELRLIAWRANERRMREVYNAKDPKMGDLHMATASFFAAYDDNKKLTADDFWRNRLDYMEHFGKWMEYNDPRRDDEWKSPIRQPGKISNFSLAYGLAPDKFQLLLFNKYHIRKTLEEATILHRLHFQLWPDLLEWHKQGQRDYMKGTVWSFFGRARTHLKDRNVALNSPVQADGSDIMQIGQTEIRRRLIAEGIDAPLCGESHDCLLMLPWEDEAEWISENIVRPVLENPPFEEFGITDVPVPFKVSIHIAETWG